MPTSLIRKRWLHYGLGPKVHLYWIPPLKANHWRMWLQWAHEYRVWQVDWHKDVISDESRFNLWDHDGHFRVRRYVGQCCLLECVIEQHIGRIFGVMVWGAISHHGWSNLQRTESNLNSNKYVREELQPEVVPFLQSTSGAIFQQHNACPHVAKTDRDFCSAQYMQLLSSPDYSLYMSPIEHVWDLVGRRYARVPHPAAPNDKLWLILAIWKSLPQADIQNCLTPCYVA